MSAKRLSATNNSAIASVSISKNILTLSCQSKPLHSLLSQALVAFTIEFDNEAEHRMAHRTSNFGAPGGRGSPWLVSMVMWFNCIRYLAEQNMDAGELERAAGTKTNLRGMQRWGCVQLRADGQIALTPAGRRAYEIWKPLFGELEQRWCDRLGRDAIDGLRKALLNIAVQLPADLPDCMPIVSYGQRTPDEYISRPGAANFKEMTLAALMAKVLLQFTRDFEKSFRLSLPVCANILQIISNEGMQVRELPVASGIAKEAIDLMLRFLQKHGLATVTAENPSPFRNVSLSDSGLRARGKYLETVNKIEISWNNRYGAGALNALRLQLTHVVCDSQRCLLKGAEPYADNWRAKLRARRVLPNQPVITHRGGYPDGS